MERSAAEELRCVATQLRDLANSADERSVYNLTWTAQLLLREAIRLGAFAGSEFVLFRGHIDLRRDQEENPRLWVAFCRAVDELADHASSIWGDAAPAFSQMRFTPPPGTGSAYYRQHFLALAELIERDAMQQEGKAEPHTPLTKNEAAIVRCLFRNKPVLLQQQSIESSLETADNPISIRMIKDCLARLEAAEIVHRPRGDRTGFGLTEVGLSLAKNL